MNIVQFFNNNIYTLSIFINSTIQLERETVQQLLQHTHTHFSLSRYMFEFFDWPAYKNFGVYVIIKQSYALYIYNICTLNIHNNNNTKKNFTFTFFYVFNFWTDKMRNRYPAIVCIYKNVYENCMNVIQPKIMMQADKHKKHFTSMKS